MKRNKLVLAVLALVLSSVMFMACGAPSTISKDKYASIISTVGNTVIVSDGSKMNLLDSKGKKTGDSAYEIEPIYLSETFTGFYQAKREASSGFELMNAAGTILQAGYGDKGLAIEAVGIVSEDENGFDKIEVNAFKVTISTSSGVQYMVMNNNGERVGDLYKNMNGQYGSVIMATTESNNKTTYHALKTDGTKIASSEFIMSPLPLDKPENMLIEVTEKTTVNNVDTYKYAVYSNSGTKIGTYSSNGGGYGNQYGKGYVYSTTTTDTTTTYYIDETGATTLAKDILGGYAHDGEYYVRVGTASDFKVRKIDSTSFITSALEYANYSYYGLLIVKEKGADKFKILRPDTGAALLSDLTTNPTIEYFYENEDNVYNLVVTDGTSLIHSANGTKKTRTLESNEDFIEYYSGAVLVGKYYEYTYSLWIPATNKNVALANGNISSSVNIISFTVKGEGDSSTNKAYATLAQNLKNWDGSTSTNNLYFQAGVPSDAYSYSFYSTGSFSYAQIPMAKSDTYTSMEKIEEAYYAGSIDVRIITARYYPIETSTSYKTVKAMLYTDSKSNTQIYQLGEDYSIELIDSIDYTESDSSRTSDYDTYFYKNNTKTGERTVHEFYLDNGTLKIREIASDLSYPTLIQSSNGSAYITSVVGNKNPKNELYDLEKNLLLPANYVIEEVCVNGYVIVSTGATGAGYANALGLVKLEKNGKHKLVKQIEYSFISIGLNGMMTLTKNYFDTFVELCDKDGKTIEAKVYGFKELQFNEGADFAEMKKSIAGGGERKVSSYAAVVLSDGTERLMTIAVSEDDLSFSVLNLLV